MTQQELSTSLLSIEDDLKSIDPSGTRVNEELGAVIAKVNLLRKLEHSFDLILFCPRCLAKHLDTPDVSWSNPPHRSHLCKYCGHIWRPSDHCTNGVAEIVSVGAADSPKANPLDYDRFRSTLAIPEYDNEQAQLEALSRSGC